MAIKPTIYKFNISLSDLDRNYYDSLNLTVALHPSETPERMMARVLALCLNADQKPTFTKGLSEVDEPDVIVRTMDNLIDLWIDVGEPATDRIKKATRLANRTRVYSFNAKSQTWWEQNAPKFQQYPAEVTRFNWEQIQALAGLVERTLSLSMTITGTTAYISADTGECEVSWLVLQDLD